MSFFTGISCVIIPNVLGKSRADLFQRKLKEFGGSATIYSLANKSSTALKSGDRVVIDPSLNYEKLLKILGEEIV